MQEFEFHNPTRLVFGRNTISRIGAEIRAGGQDRVLLIAGGGSIKENGVHAQVTDSLQEAGIAWEEAWGVQPNPVLAKVKEMVARARECEARALLCVGGGSVIDSGKAVAAGVHLDDAWQPFADRSAVEEALPLYAVLTLSATGSEMNQYAVVTHEEEQKKWNIHGPALHPRVSIIDPAAQFSLPWEQTVNGALDATAHILEQYFANDEAGTTLAVNEALLASINRAADRLREEPDHYPSRADLAWAATLALNGISGAGMGGGDWATHMIEHGISARHPEVAHGAGLGVLFPAWIEYCRDRNPALFARWAERVWGADSVAGGIAAMREKIASWGAPVTLGDLGIGEEEIGAIAANAARLGELGRVRKLGRREVEEILRLAL